MERARDPGWGSQSGMGPGRGLGPRGWRGRRDRARQSLRSRPFRGHWGAGGPGGIEIGCWGKSRGRRGRDTGGRQTGGQTAGRHRKHGVPRMRSPGQTANKPGLILLPETGTGPLLECPQKIPNDSTLEGPSASPNQGHPTLEGWWGQTCPLPAQDPHLLHSPPNPEEGPPPLPVTEESEAFHTQQALTHTLTLCRKRTPLPRIA